MEIRLATREDLSFWQTLDCHISKETLLRKMDAGECFVLVCDGQSIGVLRHGLFWDNTPFLNMIFLLETYRGKGYGRIAMQQWETEMASKGYEAVMVSTQADEQAQFFYRKLGYRDCGALVLNDPPFSQPPELFLFKVL